MISLPVPSVIHNTPIFCRMLECFHEAKKGDTVGRERVHHLPSPIFFIEKPCVDERLGVLRYGLEIGAQGFGYLLYRRAFVLYYHR